MFGRGHGLGIISRKMLGSVLCENCPGAFQCFMNICSKSKEQEDEISRGDTID